MSIYQNVHKCKSTANWSNVGTFPRSILNFLSLCFSVKVIWTVGAYDKSITVLWLCVNTEQPSDLCLHEEEAAVLL